MSPTDKNQVLTLGLNDTLTVPFILNNIGEEPSIGSKVEFSFTKYFELIKDSAYTCKINGQHEFATGFETGVSKILDSQNWLAIFNDAEFTVLNTNESN